MNKTVWLVLALFLLSFSFALAQDSEQQNKTCVYFFYGNGCPHCATVEPVLFELENKYPDLEIKKYEVWYDNSNAMLLNQYFDLYKIPTSQRGVPVAFIAKRYFLGDKPITDNLENEIIKNPGAKCPSLEQNGASGVAGDSSPLTKSGTVSLVTIAGAALVDSINPCAIAVLLILLTSLFLINEIGQAKRALKAGFMFIISIFIVYFLFGIGLFAIFKQAMNFWGVNSVIINYAVGILAILIGLINIKDYFWYGAGGFSMEIPQRWRPRLKKLLNSVTSPLGAFLIGFLVSAFELPCTGGPYFFAIGYLADKVTYSSLIPILLFYNLIFVLPLIVITLLLYFGVTSVEKADKWKERNLRNLHLIAGLIMLALGFLVMFYPYF